MADYFISQVEQQYIKGELPLALALKLVADIKEFFGE